MQFRAHYSEIGNFLSEFFDKCSDIQMEGRKDFSQSQCDLF